MKQRNFAITRGGGLRTQLGYITESEAAEVLGIAVSTFRNRQAAGTAPPHYKTGKEKLFRLDEVDAFIRRARRG